MEIKIIDVRGRIMNCWKQDIQTFRNLRDECGTYVFDAVMAVILGGTGVSKPEHSAYVLAVFHKKDVSSWKANAGLKSNNVTGTNYSQRGFFNYPYMSNNKIQLEFLPDMTIDEVCEKIKSYPEDYFRKNARNDKSDPAEDFVNTLYKILNYAGFKIDEVQKSEVMTENNRHEDLVDITKIIGEENNIMSDMKSVFNYLAKNEPKIANSISYASELLMSELDSGLKVLKKRRVEAAENDDDAILYELTEYRDIMKEYRNNIENCLVVSGEIKNIEIKQSIHIADSQKITEDREYPGEPLDEDETEPVNYALYEVDKNVPHPLHENFLHKKICAFSYMGTRYTVSNWKNALVLLCNLLAKENPMGFSRILSEHKFKGRKVSYFVNRSIPGKTEKINNTSTYVWVNLSANAIADLMADTLDYFGKDVNNFSVFLRADYTSLHKNE